MTYKIDFESQELALFEQNVVSCLLCRRNKLCAGAREGLESEDSAFLPGMRNLCLLPCAHEQVTYNTYKVTMKIYDVD